MLCSGLIVLLFLYWIFEVLIFIFVVKFLNFFGRLLFYKIVKFGFVDVFKLYNVCNNLNVVFVIRDLLLFDILFNIVVIYVGFFVNNWLYFGVLVKCIIFNFMMKWLINFWIFNLLYFVVFKFFLI